MLVKKNQLGPLTLIGMQLKREFQNGEATGRNILEYRVFSHCAGLLFNVNTKETLQIISEDELDTRNEAGDFVKISFDDLILKSWIRDNILQASATASRAHLLNAKEGGVK